jgi:hypothetical protein
MNDSEDVREKWLRVLPGSLAVFELADEITRLRDELAAAKSHPVSREEANELQDILHTLTNSGTALKTSAKGAIAAIERLRKEVEAERAERWKCQGDLASARRAIAAMLDRVRQRCDKASEVEATQGWHYLTSLLEELIQLSPSSCTDYIPAEKVREVVEFYADEMTYETAAHEPGREPIWRDRGQRARDFLLTLPKPDHSPDAGKMVDGGEARP